MLGDDRVHVTVNVSAQRSFISPLLRLEPVTR
jgi:hypothetical protein